MSAHTKSLFKTSDFLLVVTTTAGLVLELFIPSNIALPHQTLLLCGIVLFSIGFFIILVTKIQFKKMHQKTGPGKEITTLITDGVLRYSRNPIYVGVLFISVSLGFFANSWWLIVSVVPLTFLINYVLIIPEERYLENIFGDEYSQYAKNTRRWL